MRKRPPQRTLSVIRKSQITTNMMRVTLGGPELDGFPTETDGGYVKFRLPHLTEPDREVVRTYTVREQRDGEIDVDFALHGIGKSGGPATRWALDAKPGDRIKLGGPGPAKPVSDDADWYLLVGDMTSLPAISVNLEKMDDDAKGIAVIEIISEDDIQDLRHPDGVKIDWVINPKPGADNVLTERVKSIAWESGDAYAWVACEFSTMKEVRSYLRETRGLDKHHLYVSSYWKNGANEDGHRELKQADARQFA